MYTVLYMYNPFLVGTLYYANPLKWEVEILQNLHLSLGRKH